MAGGKSVRVHRRQMPDDPKGRARYTVLRADGTAYNLKLVPPSDAALAAALALPTVSARFRAVREALGISMHETARAFGTVHQVVLRVEHERVSRSYIVQNLAALAGLSEDDILRGRAPLTTVDRSVGDMAACLAEWRLINSLTRKEAAAAIGCGATYNTVWNAEHPGAGRGLSARMDRAIRARIHGARS